MTICMVGNSHAIALKEAADDFPWAFSYCCAPSDQMKDAIVRDGKLVGGTARLRRYFAAWRPIGRGNTRQGFDLKAHSAFVVVGLRFSLLMCLSETYTSVRLFNHMGRGMTMVSVDCLEEILVAQIRSSLAFKVAKLIRSNSDKPIFVVPQPAQIESTKAVVSQISESQIKKWPILVLQDVNVRGMLLPIYERALARAADHENVIVVAQPAATLNGVRTKAEYRRVDKPGDYKHVNKLYGVQVLERLKSEFEKVGV